ncbi:dihydrofolate reductase family protein [uncultured Friedmanniella sp.]|uniref:dihydrofolate reductase family protein n=1 Tax=uncultured Friedmanniella sp. TaxID=335381 RepID=UPI0035CB2905
MARLIYSGITSLDGYVADANGSFAWAMPDEEVHAYVNDAQRSIGTHLYGRRLYEVMVAWETMSIEGEPDVMRDFATSWRSADKVVYSTTLPEVSSRRTRLERRFDPESVRQLKESSERDLLVGGPGLAAAAVRADLVDEIAPIVVPVVVGGGTPFLPSGLSINLELLKERRFGNGTVALAYAVRR